MQSTKKNIYLDKFLVVTIIRELVSLSIIILLILLRDNSDDIITFVCGFVKFLILSANFYFLLQKTKNNQPRRWLLSCVLDACFSMQMLISVIFHSYDVSEIQKSHAVSGFGETYYLMISIIVDTILNLNTILLFGLGAKDMAGKTLDITLSNQFGKWIFDDCKGRMQDSYIRGKDMKYHVYEGKSHRNCLFFSSKLYYAEYIGKLKYVILFFRYNTDKCIASVL